MRVSATLALAAGLAAGQPLRVLDSFDPRVANVKRPVPGWTWGGLVIADFDDSGAPEFTVFGRDGARLRHARLTHPQVSTLCVQGHRTSLAPDGALIAAARVYGREPFEGAALATLDPGATEFRVTPLRRIFPRALVVARDGVIWTAVSDFWKGEPGRSRGM